MNVRSLVPSISVAGILPLPARWCLPLPPICPAAAAQFWENAARIRSHVIETVLELRRAEARRPKSKIRIVDVGTGSGCIALALAKELPQAEIHATDISPDALEIARANAARHQVERRIQFHQMDLVEGLTGEFDFVVSNPPYVGESEEDQVQLEVRKFEPRSAVFAGQTGTEVITRLIPRARTILRPGGWLVMVRT